MATLGKQWFYEPVFDFEYKTYQLQAYLHEVKEHFGHSMFYPYLIDLLSHLHDVKMYIDGVEKLESTLRRELESIDIHKILMLREPLPDEGRVMGELSQIADYAFQHLTYTYEAGVANLNKTSEDVSISPLGLVACSNHEGLLFFRRPQRTRIYSYAIRKVRRASPAHAYLDVRTSYLEEIRTGMLTNFCDEKMRLIKRIGNEKAINAYLVETNTEIPQYETLLPIAKQYLIKNVASGPSVH